MIVSASNAIAESMGARTGSVLADVRAIIPRLVVEDNIEGLSEKLLRKLAGWCIRFSPIVAMDLPDGLIIDATGCAHLWGGEQKYLDDIINKLAARGYSVRAAIADTPGVAWGIARYGYDPMIIEPGKHQQALKKLPPEALRLSEESISRLHKLGLHQIGKFINISPSSLRRRFGNEILSQLNKALGIEIEKLEPVQPIAPYEERLPCMDPIRTAEGIAIALETVLKNLCLRLSKEEIGLRKATFKCFRVDGKVEQVLIATSRPSHHVKHLVKLFEINLTTIDPGLGIELFILEANVIETFLSQQEKMWSDSGGLEDSRLGELLDRIAGKTGQGSIKRYLPAEHYWPERSLKLSPALEETSLASWTLPRKRPLQLLRNPEPIEVTAPIPDYPPMLFRRHGKLHKIVKADGPERIEQEWWLQQGQHRDYYCVEDEDGARYWLFRLGHYNQRTDQWFLHGFFA